ncbi:hypothetical protein RFI_16666 [Reticulomyxa filosa]|uniref:RGS domain-containing protein n=1 Tax=Reticulomyxa filosa TaxID=46433 RepID=X6N2Q8_RETFI|nr:hypothetical protein RFI_16666 [Reticulomyxa filosa]|eukprot:ETO20550.1 hypothetical protein RFI_16666 [Reticulomyxa filosa]
MSTSMSNLSDNGSLHGSITRIGCVPVALKSQQNDSSSEEDDYIDRPLPYYHFTTSSTTPRLSATMPHNGSNSHSNSNSNSNSISSITSADKKISSPLFLGTSMASNEMIRSMSLDQLSKPTMLPTMESPKQHANNTLFVKGRRNDHIHTQAQLQLQHHSSVQFQKKEHDTTFDDQKHPTRGRSNLLIKHSSNPHLVPTFEDVLQDDLLCHHFELFLKTIFCDENLLFIKG